MQIEDIVKSVQAMSTEELESRLREIRHSQTTIKEVSSKPAGRVTKKNEKVTDEFMDLFSALPEEEKRKLAELLGA